MTQEILSAIDGQLFAVWFLIGAALVFWMQAGHGGGRFYQSQEYRKYPDEKPDGLLYRHGGLYSDWLRAAAGRGRGRIHRKARF